NSHVFVNKGRNIVADIEDEPDRNEAGNAVKINQQEITNDVSIQKFHCDFRISARRLRFTITISATKQLSFRAKGGISDQFICAATNKYQRCFASLNMTGVRCRTRYGLKRWASSNDRAKKQHRQRICGTGSCVFLRERTAVEG